MGLVQLAVTVVSSVPFVVGFGFFGSLVIVILFAMWFLQFPRPRCRGSRGLVARVLFVRVGLISGASPAPPRLAAVGRGMGLLAEHWLLALRLRRVRQDLQDPRPRPTYPDMNQKEASCKPKGEKIAQKPGSRGM
mgnify:CR=1 FL=1